jgi:hypothetical protein
MASPHNATVSKEQETATTNHASIATTKIPAPPLIEVGATTKADSEVMSTLLVKIISLPATHEEAMEPHLAPLLVMENPATTLLRTETMAVIGDLHLANREKDTAATATDHHAQAINQETIEVTLRAGTKPIITEVTLHTKVMAGNHADS